MKYIILFCTVLLLPVATLAQTAADSPYGKWDLSKDSERAVMSTMLKYDHDNGTIITCIKPKGKRSGMAIWLFPDIGNQLLTLQIGSNVPIKLKYEGNETLIENGYCQNLNDKMNTDVLKQLLESDEMILQFYDKTGATKNITVPLLQFHELYEKLD